MGLIICLALILLVIVSLTMRARRLGEGEYSWVYILFFFSGFPALIYQIVWQRSLFEIYGVNIESVTIVVTAFMLGLGIGSLVGGQLSKNPRVSLLVLFGVVELGIAAYGVLSLRLFHWAAVFTAGSSTWKAGVFSFLLVLVPTVFMGSTLPLLVEHLVRKSSNVGHSVGILYFVNTLGSAAACFVAAVAMMRWLGLSGSANVAAAMNGCIGLIVLLMFFRKKEHEKPVAAQSDVQPGRTGYLSFAAAMAISCVAGFIALGYEIVWYRLFSFVTAGLAKSFPLLLGSYLTGIAFGSLFTERFCRARKGDGADRSLQVVGALVVLANMVGFLVAPLLANSVAFVGLAGGLAMVMMAAAMLGAVFPLVAHMAIPPDARSGARLSYLYLSNIVGSASGSFVIGFILMDYLEMRQVCVLLALSGLTMGLVLLLAATKGNSRQMAAAVVLGLLIGAVVVLSSGNLFNRLYEKLLYKGNWKGESFAYTVETRSGVVNVSKDGTVFGGGIYDGRFSTDLVHDGNWIIRAYALSALHPNPRNVLMIGLSSGSWAQVIVNNPQVETLTIVEINPGYLRLIRRYPQVASLLSNPKVRLYIDDGRRWLIAHPEQKFDVIVMNTTYHFRAHASALLSEDFLRIIRPHLNPGGMHYYNTTDSTEVLRTGTTVFPYSMRFFNFLAVSDSPIQLDAGRWRKVLEAYRIDGNPVFHHDRNADVETLDRIVKFAQEAGLNDKLAGFEPGMGYPQKFHASRVITDDNMGTEWYY